MLCANIGSFLAIAITIAMAPCDLTQLPAMTWRLRIIFVYAIMA